MEISKVYSPPTSFTRVSALYPQNTPFSILQNQWKSQRFTLLQVLQGFRPYILRILHSPFSKINGNLQGFLFYKVYKGVGPSPENTPFSILPSPESMEITKGSSATSFTRVSALVLQNTQALCMLSLRPLRRERRSWLLNCSLITQPTYARNPGCKQKLHRYYNKAEKTLIREVVF